MNLELLSSLNKTAYPEPATDLHHGIIGKVWREIVKPNLPLPAKVLDVGAGDGYALALMRRECGDGIIRPCGITLTEEDRLACSDKKVPCLIGDMHELPAQLAGYDLVWARHSLEHSPFPMLALSEIHRVLKPGGLLYVETPAPNTCAEHESNPNHYSVLGSKAWTQLLERSGFEVLTQRDIKFKITLGDEMYFSWLCRKDFARKDFPEKAS